MSQGKNTELKEGIVSIESANPVIKDVAYDSGSFFRKPLVPEAVHNQVIILSNTMTGSTLVIDENSTPSVKLIKTKKPNRLVVINLQPFPISAIMNLRTSSYASFLKVSLSANVCVTNGARLFAQHQANLSGLEKDIGEVLTNECFEEARRISRRFAPNEYIALEEELDMRMLNLINQQSSRQDVFSNIEIVDMHFHVSLTAEHEEILHKATFVDYENSARRSTLMSDMENMRVINQVMSTGEDADVWLEVAQGKMSPTQAVDKINKRKQERRDKEIEHIREISKQGVVSDNDLQRYMKDVLDNAVDHGKSDRADHVLLDGGTSNPTRQLPDASTIPDLDDE